MVKTPYTILSVGGSIIIPKTGFDFTFLKAFRDLIVTEIKNGKQFILVIGGGATARQYQSSGSAFNASAADLDWIGIKATALNAELVRVLFKEYAHESVITKPTKKVATTRPLIVAAGWEPGCSTDYDATLLAKTYGAKTLFNLSNVDYVYDSDPNKNPGAKKIERIGWADFRKIVGDKWTPGANVPFDPSAAKLAQKLKVTVGFIKGTDLGEVKKALSGGIFRGTVITTR
ncbi:MAG: UMP kinase [Candidatus Magasanikbacteria bacterium]|nr:UMP kinase [Candidatus Magasanikbacteria bacterium]